MILAGVVVTLINLFSNKEPSTETKVASAQSSTQVVSAKTNIGNGAIVQSGVADTSITSAWQYGTFVDPMNGEKGERYAELKSENVLNLKFPYNGGAIASLQVYNDKTYGPYASIKLSNNAFFTTGVQPRIRFDDGPVMNIYDAFGDWLSEDHKRLIFRKSYSRTKYDGFALLKKSKHLKVEALVYDNDSQIMEFSTEGLDPSILPEPKSSKVKAGKI